MSSILQVFAVAQSSCIAVAKCFELPSWSEEWFHRGRPSPTPAQRSEFRYNVFSQKYCEPGIPAALTVPNDSLDKPGAPWKPDEPTVATPTAEQLARWKHASFDPLQLLAFREHELSGQVSFVAVTNDGKHYLLGGTKLTLWDLESDEQVHEFIKANTNEDDRLIGFAVSPVGDWCADV